MENMMITTNEKDIRQPFAPFTKVIDGRTFAVRVFFPTENAEAMQEKIERMLHRDIVKCHPSNCCLIRTRTKPWQDSYLSQPNIAILPTVMRIIMAVFLFIITHHLKREEER